MNHRHALALVGLVFGLTGTTIALGKPLTDLVSPEKRRSIVDQFQRFTRAPEPVPLPADLVNPFNPSAFDQPDPEEVRAAAAAYAKSAAQPGIVGGAGGSSTRVTAPAGDREILENIAVQIKPSGMIRVAGKPPLLTFGRRNVEVGSTFTVTNPANGQDYEVALIAIEPPTFTLRYRNEEITRPIKSGKSQ